MSDAMIESLLAAMTLEEKAAMCHGDTFVTSPGVPRLGVPGLTMSDGPCGVRETQNPDWSGSARRTDDFVTGLPPGMCLAATWDTGLARRYGEVLGAEARHLEKDIILGPAINIHRTPLCGRNFEYMGEDPLLIARLVVPFIHGIQQEGVACCVKHFALNNQELGRREVNVDVDERTLREIYLAGFEAAVREGGALTFMGAYNKFRGRHCCHHDYLLDGILKQEWGFRGAVVSDWGGVHDTAEAATPGLDIEMGSGKDPEAHFLGRAYVEGLRAGLYPVAALDDKVRRILRVLVAIGKLGDRRRPAGARNTAAHQAVARQVAAEGIVLLQNRRKLLPFSVERIRTLAVIGANATARHCRGGGSAEVKPLYEVTPLEGLQNKLGDRVRILHAAGYPDLGDALRPLPQESMGGWGILGGIRGWRHVRFSNPNFSGEPIHESVEPVVDFAMPVPGMVPGESSAEWKAEFTAPVDGEYEFTLLATEWTGVKLDGRWICMTGGQVDSPVTIKGKAVLEAGKTYRLLVHAFVRSAGTVVRFGCRVPGQHADAGGRSALAEAVAIAKKADAVVFVGGLTHAQDTEGIDRRDMRLPDGQDELIAALAKANRNTVVVLYGAGTVEMPWLGNVNGLLLAWYGGMESGNALADVLFGDVNPSGKLPVTLPARLEDSPAHSVGEYRADEECYREGLFVGYRHFDAKGVEPLFPFGHGLSYTSFGYHALKVQAAAADGGPVISVWCRITNRGERAGAETVQCYLAAVDGRLPAPVKALKAFRKVFLQAGESMTIRMDVDGRALSVYDAERRAWVIDGSRFRVMVGGSSRDIRLVGEVEVRA